MFKITRKLKWVIGITGAISCIIVGVGYLFFSNLCNEVSLGSINNQSINPYQYTSSTATSWIADIIPKTNNQYDIGSISNKWANVYVTNLSATSNTISGLANGSIVFTTSSGQLSQDNSNFFWDDANNRLGIGTITPQNTLSVNGSINVFSDNYYKYNNTNIFFASTSLRSYFIGENSGNTNQSGMGNVGLGYQTLNQLSTSFGNVAIGYQAMATSTNSEYNTMVGYQSGVSIRNAGNYNVGIGGSSEEKLTTGDYNVGVGFQSCDKMTTANKNTCIGYGALFSNITGASNVALGETAGLSQTAGSYNIIIGATQNVASTTGSYQLNIGGTIYGDLLSNRIGINTSTPLSALSVVASSTDNIASFMASSTAVAMRIMANGFVAIGTTTASYGLDVQTGTATSTISLGALGTKIGCIKMQDTDKAGWSYITVLNGFITVSTTSCE